MIERTEYITSMLNNIIEKSTIILNDFEMNGKTHFTYVLEKLRSAKSDLDDLVKIAENKRDELNKELGIE